MYNERLIKPAFTKCAKLFPVILLAGPRQSGKTTFLKMEYPDSAYITFDDPVERDFARKDPVGFLDRFKASPLIIEEIQYVPEILSYIKINVDKNRIPGRWILTCSQHFHLMKSASESLSGRIAILELAPLCYHELMGKTQNISEVLWNSLFPEPALNHEKRDFWIRSYTQTYLERDIRQLDNIRDFRSFETMINLCASLNAQEIHPTQLSRDCGVSVQTINNWIRLLETSYFAFSLQPFHNNFGKRIVKAPKLYFMDQGVCAYLTRQSASASLLSSGMGSSIFEGFIAAEALKCFMNRGLKPDMSFWRSHDGLEIDLIFRTRNQIHPVEVNLTATPNIRHFKSIERFRKLAKSENIGEGILVCQTPEKREMPEKNWAIPWFEFYGWLDSKLAGS